jgi:uncharacterized membrane protein YadS
MLLFIVTIDVSKEIFQFFIDNFVALDLLLFKNKLIYSLMSFIKKLNSMELWPIWIGFFWFILLVSFRATLDIGPDDLSVWSNDADFVNQFHTNLVTTIVCFILATLACLIMCHAFLDKPLRFLEYFIVLCIVIAAKIIGTNKTLKSLGLGTSFWCIIIGCVIRTLFRDFGQDLKHIMSMEFFIKIGIVLFAIDVQKISELGPKGIVIGWIETSLLLVFVYVIGAYVLRIDHVRSLLISSGLSICGSSAIMAIADVLNQSQDQQENQENEIVIEESVQESVMRELNINRITLVTITILSIFSIPYIPILPILCRYFSFSSTVCGLWIGGTIDSTGTVIASASLLDQTTLDSAVFLKMLQNIIIGPVTLVITSIIYRSINPQILFDKFPKFVIGFLVVSFIVSSFTLELRNKVTHDLFIASEWFSHLSFALIGLDIDIQDTSIYTEWRMLFLYVFGQTLDTFTTLGLSIWLFG